MRVVDPTASLTPDEMAAVVVALELLRAAPRRAVESRDETPRWRFSGREFGLGRRFA